VDSIDAQLADEIIAHAVDLLRLEAGTRARVLRLLEDLRAELAAKLREDKLTEFGKLRTQQLVKQASEIIDGYYAKMQGELSLALQGAAQSSASNVANTITATFHRTVVGVLPTEKFLARLVSNVLIQGAPSAEWWSRQSQKTAFNFANAVRLGVAGGETNETIVRRLTKPRSGVMDISARDARALIHTSIQTVAAEARRDTFKENRDVVKGMRQLSTLDGQTTVVCIAYAGGTWDLDGKPIMGWTKPYNGGVPRHWGCRSVEVPITKTFRELGLDVDELPPAMRASVDGPVPADITFDKWLRGRTQEQQDAQLGKGRAELWRAGKITLQQLLDLHGTPLTVGQLMAKYGTKA
jgi:hypothetical protein